MNADQQSNRARFYFALPRLVAKLNGENSDRAVTNGHEANIASVSIFAITYLFGCLGIASGASRGRVIGSLFLLIFVTWIFWLVAFYLNAVAIRLCRHIGIFRRVEVVRAQSILIVGETTVFAIALALRGDWFAIAASIWLTAVALNLSSAVVLRLLDGSRGASV